MMVKELKDALYFVCTLEFWWMAVSWTFSLLFSYLKLFAKTLFSRNPISYPRCPPSPLPPPLSKTASSEERRPICIITGVMEDLKKRNKHANVKCFQVDLSSFHSILKFKDSFQQWLLGSDLHSSLQLLINNAGILATSFRPTAEGFDQVMATNYIGAFSLTKVLLPLLENSPVPSRIVNVTSFTHRAVSDIQVDKETVSGKPFSKFKTYPYAHAYAYSKLFLLLFSYELHRQFDIMGKSRQSPENGVRCILDAALAPPEISGVYFFGGNGRTVNSSALTYNAKLGKKLWATSCDLFRELQLTSKDTSF
ncbi:NAD(P)-binding Rossmann-fold superfamily protein [Actinidia rufa]|uniref:NAD(P)-binding Rossmann-fold superfamily protein n=1 Tax=Actinidia rufa TaxID=165716 RepID=A0A7J0GWZ4_9ERIC|nr:NAD(P)-binding Rossmann-fold superfamily protein [Actinidia rufa]